MLKISFIGHLGKDAVVNNVNGKTVVNFTVAHTEKYKDSSGVQKENTTWIDCSWWLEKTSIAQYLKKGTQIFCEGTPSVRTWDKDGKHGASLSVRVGLIQLLGGGNKTTQPEAQQPNNITEPIDDLPF